MIRVMMNNWWLLFLRGLFALVFAIAALGFQPFFSTMLLAPWAFAGLVIVFGLLAVINGLITLGACLHGNQKKRDLWTLLAEGLVMLGAGAAVLFIPGLTLFALVRTVAVATFILGFLELMAGIHLRRHLADERMLIAGGVASLLFAMYLLLGKAWQVPSLLVWIAVYAAANGLAIMGLAVKLRRLRASVHQLAHSAGQ
jgi:uncharacterized membrane protein HdeD (DUF308 family)